MGHLTATNIKVYCITRFVFFDFMKIMERLGIQALLWCQTVINFSQNVVSGFLKQLSDKLITEIETAQ